MSTSKSTSAATDVIRSVSRELALADIWLAVSDHPDFVAGAVFSRDDCDRVQIDPDSVDAERVAECLVTRGFELIEAFGDSVEGEVVYALVADDGSSLTATKGHADQLVVSIVDIAGGTREVSAADADELVSLAQEFVSSCRDSGSVTTLSNSIGIAPIALSVPR